MKRYTSVRCDSGAELRNLCPAAVFAKIRRTANVMIRTIAAVLSGAVIIVGLIVYVWLRSLSTKAKRY
jgi:hypothetical protein